MTPDRIEIELMLATMRRGGAFSTDALNWLKARSGVLTEGERAEVLGKGSSILRPGFEGAAKYRMAEKAAKYQAWARLLRQEIRARKISLAEYILVKFAQYTFVAATVIFLAVLIYRGVEVWVKD